MSFRSDAPSKTRNAPKTKTILDRQLLPSAKTTKATAEWTATRTSRAILRSLHVPALQDQLLQLWKVPSTRELAREGGNLGAHALQGVQVADQGGAAGPEGDRAPLRHEAHRQHRQEGWGCAVVVFSSTIML